MQGAVIGPGGLGAAQAGRQLGDVAISFNKRTYRFSCGDAEVQRLEDIANYLKSKLDALMTEHGPIGDERLMLMAALVVADELFDARADIDELLESKTEDLKSVSEDGDAYAATPPAVEV